ncbi:MAG: isovaleryl-CoA dehydrogenase [Alphaproteobacteria bacterium]|nr:isovaleryl-CoA dehydrogenase [Alphaproteobacteria bacterium]
MAARNPVSALATHEVTNQPPPLEPYNLYESDPALKEALKREGGKWAETKVRAFGERLGAEDTFELGRLANEYPPELKLFDRYGHRIDEVEFHPAYHHLMALAIENEVPSVAWTAKSGGHVVHTALEYMLIQVEAGVCCPMAMTYAGVPALRNQPELAAEWEPKILSTSYDKRFVPATEKAGITIGMAMTEKQGGSDVRANSTRAQPINGGGPGGEYELVGHKWFCSAPMSDAFLTLAYTKEGLSCFFVPRWKPDGTRNPFFIQRLKDKLGNKSNASSEIEYDATWARMVGEEGAGVRTIMEMVQHTRLDTTLAPAGMMRQAVVRALHHTAHRTAFQRVLLQQPLMRNVLADMAVECEAGTTMVMRIARAYDNSAHDNSERLFARLAVAVAKYWLNKRISGLVNEAMECLGGAGYVEESTMPRLYREAPLNGIWEGSGNVICLDVLRAMQKEPNSVAVFIGELEASRGGDRRLDLAIDRLKALLADRDEAELRARRITEAMALALEGALLVRHAPPAVADAFCGSRLGGDWHQSYGTLPTGLDLDAVIDRNRAGLA